MTIHRKKAWAIPERQATPEGVFQDRRRVLKALGFSGAILAAPAVLKFATDPNTDRRTKAVASKAVEPAETTAFGQAARNPRYTLDRPLTEEMLAISYNNFYEFGSHKSIFRAAQALVTDPWTIKVDGAVEKPFEIGFEDLIKKVTLEERLYRHRCVEAWAMAVPWTGFPLKALVDLARPLGKAKYVRFQTFQDPEVAPGHQEAYYPWPYTEGITVAEATNELAFLVTGAYGKTLPKQMGAPLRLALPWKYGFKSIKSIVRLSFVEERPKSFWETLQAKEYGFWANVNPEVPHPRWSQAREKMLGTGEMIPTQLFNGYGEFVAGLYKGLEGERLYI
ncbi:MAG: protein-methionine-sulfoxide reductase catalytic subunit MsrP [Methyloligellaceae bacterium]